MEREDLQYQRTDYRGVIISGCIKNWPLGENNLSKFWSKCSVYTGNVKLHTVGSLLVQNRKIKQINMLLETELFSVREKKYKCGHQVSFFF